MAVEMKGYEVWTPQCIYFQDTTQSEVAVETGHSAPMLLNRMNMETSVELLMELAELKIDSLAQN